MAFAHLSGVTTPGAPNSVVDWFATFEAWIVPLGWNVVAGAGTTNLRLYSTSEAGGLNLYVHVWQDLGNPTHVRIEVSDDAVPTHETNEAGFVDSGGVQFAYWMSADKDAMVFVWKVGAGYRMVYGGLVRPFALTVASERNSMVAMSALNASSVLQYHTGAWDVDVGNYWHEYLDDVPPDQYDGSVTHPGLVVDRYDDICGQAKHISGRIIKPAVNVEDTMNTTEPAGDCTWIVLQDHLANQFALRTGGTLPVGTPDGASFTSASGNAATIQGLIASLGAFLTGIGWTVNPAPGWPGGGGPATFQYRFHTTGESGLEDYYVYFWWYNDVGAPLDRLYLIVADDAAIPPTHTTLQAGLWRDLDGTFFPLNYWFFGDLDCFGMIVQEAGPVFPMYYAGIIAPFSGNLVPPYVGPPLTDYKAMAHIRGSSPATDSRLLRCHDGTWDEGGADRYDGAYTTNSNPNAYDGTTYLLWPMELEAPDAIGPIRYYFWTHGGGIAILDTITVGAEIYTIFFDPTGNPYAVRTT